MRWLALAVDGDGQIKAAIVDDTTNSNLPFGTHAPIIQRLDGCEELTALVQLPDGDFRPEVIDVNEDAEAPVVFIDL